MSSRARRRLSWLGIVLVAVGALVVATQSAGGPASEEERLDRVAAELRCPVCQGLSVLDSDSSTAQSIRDDITRRVTDGESDAEIRQAYVDRYGEWILLRPSGRGFGAVVWLAPVVAAAGGLVGVVMALLRWRRRLADQPTAEDRAVVARAIERSIPGET